MLTRMFLTLAMPNFLNGITHFTFLAHSIIIFRDIKMRRVVEPGQIAWMCMLDWHYTGGKGYLLLVHTR